MHGFPINTTFKFYAPDGRGAHYLFNVGKCDECAAEVCIAGGSTSHRPEEDLARAGMFWRREKPDDFTYSEILDGFVCPDCCNDAEAK